MNAAAAARLDAILRSAGGASVDVAAVQIHRYPMSPGLLRERFAKDREVEVHADGIGALQAEGSWLWIDAQPGGTR